MMEYSDAKFKIMQTELQEYFNDYFSKEDCLFRLDCDAEEIWNIYLSSLPDEIGGICHEKHGHDCERCWAWFKSMANVVMIDSDFEIKTLFGFETIPEYGEVFKVLDEFLKTKSVNDVFLFDQYSAGVFNSFSEHDGECHHFYLDIPDKFHAGSEEISSEMEDARMQRRLFEEALNLISPDAVDTVLGLVYSKSLYGSVQWKDALEDLREAFEEYERIDENSNNWLWKKSAILPRNVTNIINTAMGTLLLDITEGMDLMKAVTNYEKITAPESHRTYSSEMLADAKSKIKEMGYEDSLERRFAKLEDISINNLLFANRNVKATIGNTIFDELKLDASRKVHSFDNVSEISLDEFINSVLADAQEISLYADSKFSDNFVSLIAPMNADAPGMFQWDNPFSWAYEDNITDCHSNSSHWNVTLDDFVAVSVICFSPNFWNGNEFGDKHIFFMLKDCINDSNPRGWLSEYLNNELYPHRNVMEALSFEIRVEDTQDQLSGIGFALGKPGENKITVKVKTKNNERIWNVII
jgi:tetratricopeptide (TPR) repeat protein